MNSIVSAATVCLALGSALPASAQIGAKAGYTLIWNDEFTGSAMDTANWGYRLLGARNDAVLVKDAVVLDGKGNLLIRTYKSAAEYRTGMIASEGKFDPLFGYFEARVRFNKSKGLWPAFWMQSPTVGKYIGDPGKSGAEIDIFEKNLNQGAEAVQVGVHYDGYGADHKQIAKAVTVSGINDGYHILAVSWTDKEYVWYIDGLERFRTTAGLSRTPEFLILDCSIMKWAGNIATAVLPDTVAFDYVRAYAKGVAGSFKLSAPAGGEKFPAGRTVSLKWDTLGQIKKVKLEYRMDNGSYITISPSTPNDGSYDWKLPDSASKAVRIRISSLDNAVADTTGKPFAIEKNAAGLAAPAPSHSHSSQIVTAITWMSKAYNAIGRSVPWRPVK